MIFLFKRKLSLQTEELSRVNPTAHPVIGFSPYDSELATFTMHVSSLSRTFVAKSFSFMFLKNTSMFKEPLYRC